MMRARPFHAARGVAALAAALLAAHLCACVAGPAPRDHFYRVVVEQPARGGSEFAGILEVERFASDATLRDRGMLKATPGSVEVTPYAYHLWVDSPTLMLQRALADYLRAAGVADRVVTPDAGASEDWQVTGTLRRFDFVQGAEPAAHVELELRLRPVKGGEPVEHGIYRAERPVDAAQPEAAARAFSLAVGDVFAQFTSDLRAAATAP